MAWIRQCIHLRKYKGKTHQYKYYQLEIRRRDPNNKNRIITRSIHLGKHKHLIPQKIEEYKRELQGIYSFDRLMKKLSQEIARMSE